MQRNRLKNIINKSKNISKQVDNPFDYFKNSLPKEIQIGDNYRLEAAWKAYGSPKDYKEALWNGLIQPIDETTVKFPSIGYNEETESYEYLNKGKENDIVAKDIRVWDNDVIPLVKELKLGGYVRTFNEEKDCWTYSKNPQEREQSVENTEQQVIDSFQKGGQMNVIPEGALHARKNNMEGAGEDFTAKGIPVIDNNGEQQAEIEKNEVIFSKKTTDKIEELYKKFNDSEKDSEKDEVAIEMGKILTSELMNNTDDKTGLIEEVKEKM